MGNAAATVITSSPGFTAFSLCKCDVSEEKAISLHDCCKNGMECSYFDQYIEDECTWATKDDEKTILEMIERFMVFCKESQGFIII